MSCRYLEKKRGRGVVGWVELPWNPSEKPWHPPPCDFPTFKQPWLTFITYFGLSHGRHYLIRLNHISKGMYEQQCKCSSVPRWLAGHELQFCTMSSSPRKDIELDVLKTEFLLLSTGLKVAGWMMGIHLGGCPSIGLCVNVLTVLSWVLCAVFRNCCSCMNWWEDGPDSNLQKSSLRFALISTQN